jgi:hypothetical protein
VRLSCSPISALAVNVVSMSVKTDHKWEYCKDEFKGEGSTKIFEPGPLIPLIAYDNAVAESFFSNLKNEWVHHHDFMTREDAKLAIFDYIECFNNRNRIHHSLGYRTPDEVEKSYYGA